MIWCAEHKVEAFTESQCWVNAYYEEAREDCRMVEAVLIVREPDGSWPEWAVKTMLGGGGYRRTKYEIERLDNLASSGRGE